MLCTIVQARMGSTRLPGKTLIKVGGKTILGHVLDRIGMCQADTGRVVVATSAHGGDNVIEDLCRELKVDCYRSSERDVLHRYETTATHYNASVVLRVTADCPLLCPELTAQILRYKLEADYVSFASVPLGLTPERITAEALHRCWLESYEPDDREHVTLYAIHNPDKFRTVYLRASDLLFDRSTWRLTVDTPADIELLEHLYGLTGGELFRLQTPEIVAAVEQDRLALELATRRA